MIIMISGMIINTLNTIEAKQIKLVQNFQDGSKENDRSKVLSKFARFASILFGLNHFVSSSILPGFGRICLLRSCQVLD